MKIMTKEEKNYVKRLESMIDERDEKIKELKKDLLDYELVHDRMSEEFDFWTKTFWDVTYKLFNIAVEDRLEVDIYKTHKKIVETLRFILNECDKLSYSHNDDYFYDIIHKKQEEDKSMIGDSERQEAEYNLVVELKNLINFKTCFNEKNYKIKNTND